MPTPIIEKITRDVCEALKGIKIAMGYNADAIVERPLQNGNRMRDNLIVVSQDFTVKDDTAPEGRLQWRQSYSAKCYCIESEESTRTIDERINLIRSDVEKALMVDHHRGEMAVDTIIIEPDFLYDDNDAGRLVGVAVNFDVLYRTLEEDPYQQGC